MPITRDIGMGAGRYGQHVRATDNVALIPIEDDERGDGRRTYVYVAGIDAPIVASRSERAILADMEQPPNLTARATDSGPRRWRRPGSGAPANGRRRA